MALETVDIVESLSGLGSVGPYYISLQVQVDGNGNAKDLTFYTEDVSGVVSDITSEVTVTGLSFTTTTAYDDTYTIHILRSPEPTQSSKYQHAAAFPSKRFEDDLDRIYMVLQHHERILESALKVPLLEGLSLEFPKESDRANRYIGFDSDGVPVPLSHLPNDATPITDFAKTLLDDTDAAAMRTTLGVQGISYQPGESYEENRIVSYSGKLYRSKADNNQGNQPNTSPLWWELLPDPFADRTELASLSHADRFPVWDQSTGGYYWIPASRMKNFPPGMLVTHEISASTLSPVAHSTWGTTPLNTIRHNQIAGASADVVTDHDITLPAGTYFIHFRQFFMRGFSCQARLYNVTAGSVISVSHSSWGHNEAAAGPSHPAEGECYVTFAQETTLRLEHIYSYDSPYEIGFAGPNFDTPLPASAVHILQINELAQEVTQNYDQGAPPLLWFEHQENSGVNAGSASAGVTYQRVINTVITNEISGASVDLVNNEFTLPSGRYEARIIVPFFTHAHAGMQHTYATLVDETAGLVRLRSGSRAGSYQAYVYGAEVIEGVFEITQESTFRIDQWFSYSRGTDGLGRSSAKTGEREVYTRGFIRQIATADPPTITYSYNANTPPTMIVEHQETAGTNGGVATTGSWQTRKANVAVLNEISGASLASNQITLPEGTYEFTGWQSFYLTSNTSVRLYDTTSGRLLGSGSSGYLHTSYSGTIQRPMQGRFSLSTESVLEMQYQVQAAGTSTALGDASYADPEVHAHITIKQIA